MRVFCLPTAIGRPRGHALLHGSMTRLRWPPRPEVATESGRCPARLRPAGRARLLSPQNSVQMRTIRASKQPPVREDCVRLVAIARTGSSLPCEQKAAGTGLSNGVHMLIHFATDGSTKTAAIAAMARRLQEAFRTVGLKGMTPTCGNGVTWRAGPTGAEVG